MNQDQINASDINEAPTVDEQAAIKQSHPMNKYSRILTQDVTQPAAQAMYYAIGFTEEDFGKAQVGIASMGWDGNPCNMHLNDLATSVKEGVDSMEGLV